MEKQEPKGNIILSGFKLTSEEMTTLNKVIGKYAEKIRNFTDYEELKLEAKTHLKSEKKKYEMKISLRFNQNIATAGSEGFNVFVLTDKLMKKIIQKVENKIKKI